MIRLNINTLQNVLNWLHNLLSCTLWCFGENKVICSHVGRTELNLVKSLISEAVFNLQNCSFIRGRYNQDKLYTYVKLSINKRYSNENTHFLLRNHKML